MSAITSVTYDLLGHVVFDAQRGYYNEERRVTSVKTLDGGVVVDDAGFAYGDTQKTFNIRNPTEAQITRIKRLLELHDSHRLFVGDRVFSGTLKSASYIPGNGATELQVRFAVEDRLDG